MPVESGAEQPVAAPSRPLSRQATVSEFNPDTGAGAVLDDNGRREEFSGTAFRAGGLRLLRIGQRVRLDYIAHGSLDDVPDDNTDASTHDGAEDVLRGHVRKITLITLP